MLASSRTFGHGRLLIALLALAAPMVSGGAYGQGFLFHVALEGRAPAGDDCTLEFTVWSERTAGSRTAGPILRSVGEVRSQEGYVELDLDSDHSGEWLETAIRCPSAEEAVHVIGTRTPLPDPTLRVHP